MTVGSSVPPPRTLTLATSQLVLFASEYKLYITFFSSLERMVNSLSQKLINIKHLKLQFVRFLTPVNWHIQLDPSFKLLLDTGVAALHHLGWHSVIPGHGPILESVHTFKGLITSDFPTGGVPNPVGVISRKCSMEWSRYTCFYSFMGLEDSVVVY